MSGQAKKSIKRWWMRAAGSLVLLAILAWIVPVREVLNGFAKVPLWLFAEVVVMFLVGHLAAAAKWRALVGGDLTFWVAVRAHFAGLASNLMLPGVAGGDAVRAVIAQAHVRDGGRIVATALTDRLIDMLALAGVVGIGVLMLSEGETHLAMLATGWEEAAEVLGVFLFVLVMLLYVAPGVINKLWAVMPALPARGLALRMSNSLRDLGRQPVLVLRSLALSIAIQSLFVLLAAKLALAVGLELPVGAWFFAWPLAKLLAVLPISLGGLGLREATLAALLAPFGADAAQVVAAGLAWQAVLFTTGILGAIVLWLTGGFYTRPEDQQAPVAPQPRHVQE